MTLIRDLAVILADTGPFCRVAEAGEAHLEMTAEYLRPNVKIVDDVRKELRRRSETPEHSRLGRLKLLDVPEDDAITITDSSVLSQIDTILKRRRKKKPGHEAEDRGEVFTALGAHALGYPVLMDDGYGKKLAVQRQVPVFTTQDLAVEMAATGHMKAIYAYGIYRIVYTGTDQVGYLFELDGEELHFVGRRFLPAAKKDAQPAAMLLIAAGRQAAGMEEFTEVSVGRDLVADLGVIDKNTWTARGQGARRSGATSRRRIQARDQAHPERLG